MFNSLPLESRVLLFGVGIVILAANPTTYDPFNVSRFFLLSILASLLFITFFKKDFKEFYKESKVIILLCTIFCLQLFLVLLFSQANLDQQVFGVFGRNLGLVTYLSLVVVFLSALRSTTRLFLNNLFKLPFKKLC